MVALDFDPNAANTFKKNMPETEVIVGDITETIIKEKKEGKRSGYNNMEDLINALDEK